MKNKAIIEQFYTSFQNRNIDGMLACYHNDIEFEDPAFGKLFGNRAKAMWQMLLSRDNGLKIVFKDTQADENQGSAHWTATYIFAQTGRNVINEIDAKFVFKDGKIIKHTDTFNLYRWTKQALGWKGYLLGWTKFMKTKIQRMTNSLLDNYLHHIL